MADQQGTGKHGHKDSQEPWPHTKEHEGKGGSEHQGGEHRSTEHRGSDRRSEHGGEHQGSENADLKQREYRDDKGEVHHHTKTYMEDHNRK